MAGFLLLFPSLFRFFRLSIYVYLFIACFYQFVLFYFY
jgi:hypothetical protein